MPFQFSWILEGRILYSRVYGTVSDSDDLSYDDHVREYLDRGAGLPVHIITDYTGLETIQTEICADDNRLDSSLGKHPALGCRVAVGGDRPTLQRFLEPLCSYALKPPANQFTTLELALSHLAQIDQTLPLIRLSEAETTLPKPA